MRLGFFDSGLGGLQIARAVRLAMPDVDILYAGDTLHLPYGNRSPEAIATYTRRAIDYLFAQDCALIIVACNTASAGPLRWLQQVYLPSSAYASRRILGVIVPTLECAVENGDRRIGLLATQHTTQSGIYAEELRKINPAITLTAVAAPLLVPMIENDGLKWIEPILAEYLKPLAEAQVTSVILGCTHYSVLKARVQACLEPAVTLLAQDEIIPAKLSDYLRRHPEIDGQITRRGETRFVVSDLTLSYAKSAQALWGGPLKIEHVHFPE